MNHNERLILIDGVEKADEIFFRSMVGGLIYLSRKARYHVCCELVSRFMHSPSRHHLGAAKRILRYIQETLNYGIRYTKVQN